MATRAELEAAIIAAPLDPGPRMVYGDWLQAQGDPRGEWAAMQTAIERAPSDVRLRSAAVAYLDAHRTAILGDAVDLMPGAYLGWRGGFVDEVRLQPTTATSHGHLVLWAHPTFRFVRHAAIGAIGGVTLRDAVVQRLAAVAPPLLDSVVVIDANATDARFTVDLLADLPALRKLSLHRAQLARPLPQLRELVVSVEPDYPWSLDWLARKSCPQLEALTLLYLDGGLCDAERVADVVTASPALRRLRVIGARGMAHLSTRLPTTQLDLLDLSHSDFRDQTYAAVSAWPRRPELYAWCTNVSDRLARRATASHATCGVYAIEPQTPTSWLTHRLTTEGRDALRDLPGVGAALYNLGTKLIVASDANARAAIPYLDASATLPVAGLYGFQLANAAIAHERALELDEAELRAREALLYMPGEPNFYAILIDALRRTGRIDEAAALIPAALKTVAKPPRTGAHVGAAGACFHDCLLTLAELGRDQEVLDLAAKKKYVKHITPESHAVLAIANLALGRVAEARAALFDAAKATRPVIHHARALMFAAEGKLDQARVAIDTARSDGYTAMAWIERDPRLAALARARPAKPPPRTKPEPAAKPRKRSGKKPKRQR